MIYLVIMFSVAAVGITTLWVQQKRERAHLESSEKFLSSLQKISPEVRPIQRVARKRPVRRRSAPPAAVRRGHARRRPAPAGSARRPSRSEAERREAARRRVEARRQAQRRAVRSRAAS